MEVLIDNPIQSTWFFFSIFFVALLLSIRLKKDAGLSISLTQELKGFAILAVIFSHIGYFLTPQHEFLFPLSIFAGVGVDLFLFLSGYGLTIGKLKKEETVFQFYKKRMSKVLIPFWIVLVSFLILDYFVLRISYSELFVVKAFLGIFTSAHIYNDINSPFWYLTLLLFYYLLFPVLFSKKRPWFTALILYFIPYFIIRSEPQFLQNVIGLHRVHIVAFPLGICVASLGLYQNKILKCISSQYVERIKKIYSTYKKYIHPILISLLICIIAYFSIHSGIGKGPQIEQFISLITVGAIIFLFLIKKIEFKLLSVFGLYSYELYLLHWPIMYRYDFLYTSTPAWVATSLYLVLFVGLGWILKKFSEKICYVLKI